MNGSTIQRAFLPMFGALVVLDYLCQLASSAGLAELQPLISLWSGPLDDIFYGMAGVQAAYYLVDPFGETRDSELMSWTASVKKIAGLLSGEEYRRAYLPQTFFTGSLRAAGLLADGVILAVMANILTHGAAWSALLVLLQRYLACVLPISGVIGAALLWALGKRPERMWSLALLGGSGAFLASIVFDGRWAHHVHHLLASISNLQAWGAALCWIAAGASLPLTALRVDPMGSGAKEPSALPAS